MNAEMLHPVVGGLVLLVSLVVGIWAVLAARGGHAPGLGLRLGVVLGLTLLVIQVLIGSDLVFRLGLRPIAGPLALVHMGAPYLALLGAAYHVFGPARNRVKNYAIAMLLTFGLGLISYGIGEVGQRAIGT